MEEFWKVLGGKLLYILSWIIPSVFIAFGLGLIRKEKFPSFFERCLGSILLLSSVTSFFLSKAEGLSWFLNQKISDFASITWTLFPVAVIYIFLDSLLMVLGLSFLLEKFGMYFSWKRVLGVFLILYGMSVAIFSIGRI